MFNNRYGTLAAWVYDLDKPIGHSFGDIEFYGERLRGCRGPILEPAVGNGRMSIPLLAQGFELVGFDASEEMLARCRAHCEHHGVSPELTLQRFESFAAIILPVGSFQLITDFGQARATLERFHAHLEPGGRLILDLDQAGTLITAQDGIRSWQVPEDDYLTLTTHPLHTDFAAQTTHAYLRYEHWQQGKLVGTELERFSLRWWGIQEFAMLLREASFVDVTISGDYRHGRMPTRESRMITFEAFASC
ncbi:SAM-dependent methyltransferase [Litchfieldella qijiaojingensis]|uniref:SAM-dependent methyltransferase n=1 Tax=Litchfieldella qijiaojingensis TaxID=980347 RepID=A0ABQ2YQ98_9GAMM|nr:class I SAM-dependent methyltransferase [Halomonas qijiaojingensis]GGX89248.1 SAM-dependent methyltransferase [Halomonas qijiaojingensis]